MSDTMVGGDRRGPTKLSRFRRDIGPSVYELTALWIVVHCAIRLVQSFTGRNSDGTGGFFVASTWAGRWDAGIYQAIARDGYSTAVDNGNQPGWFPGFPLVLRLGRALNPNVLGDDGVSIVVASITGVLALMLFDRWLRTQTSEHRTLWCGALAFVLVPHAIFVLGVPYAESTFLVFVVSAFIAIEMNRPWAAAALCFCASSTRIVGVAAAPALVLLMMERERFLSPSTIAPTARWKLPLAVHRERFRPQQLIPLLGVGGAAAYLVYCWVAFGDPWLYFRINDRLLVRSPLLSSETLLKWRLTNFHNGMLWHPDGPDMAKFFGTHYNMLLAIGLAVSVPFVGRRFGWGYALYVAAVFGSIWTGSPLLGATGRYALAAFPVLGLIAGLLANRRRWQVVASLAVSGCLLVVVALCWDVQRPPGGW